MIKLCTLFVGLMTLFFLSPMHADTAYTFTAEADRDLAAVFEAVEYKITVSAEPQEGGTVSGGGIYEEGTEVTANADRVLTAIFDGYFINPYDDINWNTIEYHDANFHTHTTQSDGELTPDVAIDRYAEIGYRILAITDHNALTWTWEKFGRNPDVLNMVAIQGNEISGTHHLNSFFSDYKYGGNSEETALTGIGEKDGLAFFNHPGRYGYLQSWYAEFYEEYDHLIGMEVFNRQDAHPQDRELWDHLLAEFMPDRPIWGFGNDDMHHPHELGWNRNVMLVPELTKSNVRSAMENGQFYIYKPENHQDKPALAIQEIIVTEDEIALIIEGDYDEVNWRIYDPFAEESKYIHTGEKISVYDIPKFAAFVRAEIEGLEGKIYTQPFGIVFWNTLPEVSVVEPVIGSEDVDAALIAELPDAVELINENETLGGDQEVIDSVELDVEYLTQIPEGSITIGAEATDEDKGVDFVEFFVNDSSIGVANTSPYSVYWTPQQSGYYDIYAAATDSVGEYSKSEVVTVAIGEDINMAPLASKLKTSYVSGWEELGGINNRIDPASSSDKDPGGAWGTWYTGAANDWDWIQYDFSSEITLARSEVYWWSEGGGILLPYNNYLEYWDEEKEEWLEVPDPVVNGKLIPNDKYGLDREATEDNPAPGGEGDMYNVTAILNKKITTTKVRLHAITPESEGVLEWKVYQNTGDLDIDSVAPGITSAHE